MKTNR